MLIKNDRDRLNVIGMIGRLVDEVEEYDKAVSNDHDVDAGKYFDGFKVITMEEIRNISRDQYERDLDQRFQLHVAGSFGPQHPLDDSGPRGSCFFGIHEGRNK